MSWSAVQSVWKNLVSRKCFAMNLNKSAGLEMYAIAAGAHEIDSLIGERVWRERRGGRLRRGRGARQ